jgi:hypothetical protein
MTKEADMSMWDYAVRSIACSIAAGDKQDAERRADNWQRNVAFDKFKLLAAAREHLSK